MKKSFFLMLAAITVAGNLQGGISTDTKRYNFDLIIKGGGMTNVVYSDANGKVALSNPGEVSFTEKVFSDNGDTVTGENFADLDFQLVKDQRTDGKVLDITLSAGGVAAFDWLRITKKYIFKYRATEFTVEYTLTNRSDKAQRAGLWIKTMLRPVTANAVTIHQFREGKDTMLIHPGNAAAGEWSINPQNAIYGITGKDAANGIIYTLSRSNVMGYCAETAAKDGKNTAALGIFIKPVEIAPHSSVTVPVKVEYNRMADKKIAALAGRQANRVVPDAASIAAMEKLQQNKYIAPLQPTFSEPDKFAEFTVKNQYLDQIRSVVIPAGTAVENPAVYMVYNNRIDRDKVLESKLVRQADNSCKLLFKLPGIAPEEYYYTKFMDNKCYYWRYNGKIKIYRGDEFVKVRVVMNAPVKAPELKADKANLFYNGDFEKPDSTNTFADGNYWEIGALSRNIFFWENGKGSNQSKVIRLKRENNTRFTAAYSKYFCSEPGKRYTFSMDIKVDNPNRKYVIGIINFYDKNGKNLNKYKINFSEITTTCDWKRISHTFTAPQEAAVFSVGAQLSSAGIDNTAWIDNLALEAEELQYK